MTTAPAQPLLLQLLDPANRADPYRICAQFRDGGPLQLAENNVAVFSTYRDCDEVLRHPSSSSNRFKSTMTQRLLASGAVPRPQGPPSFLFLDPPDHTRLRKLVSKAFAPKVVNGLQPEISALVDGLLDRIAEKGEFDVVEDFAYPLPVAVICRLLGVPLEDEPKSAAPRRCWRNRWTLSPNSPANCRTVSRSGSGRLNGCANTSTA